MELVFIELAPFERVRTRYLDDEEYLRLQLELIKNPRLDSPILGSGGARKLRVADPRRGKGKLYYGNSWIH